MRSFPHLKREKKTGIFAYYRRVPEDAQEAFGRKTYERSLGTRDKRALSERWNEEHKNFEERLASARNRGPQPIAQAEARPEIPVTLLVRIVAGWKQRELHRARRWWFQIPSMKAALSLKRRH